MRIAFLNPFRIRNAAENQAFRCLEIAASRIGHEVVHCATSNELEDTAPDFVLNTSCVEPKLTRFPTYSVVCEPLGTFVKNKDHFRNLLSNDGYLTISDTLAAFLRNLLHGVGRPAPIGFYYNTCQQNIPAPDFLSRLRKGQVRLTYFGTNWDADRRRLFKALCELEGIEIYGPEESWRGIKRAAYKGCLAFDGVSVQEKYKQNGIGLVMLTNAHLTSGSISNRIFEIASVGAIAICCRMPWLEENFGDSVFYFDQDRPAADLARQIRTVLDEIRANPLDAFNRAQRAHRIFQEKFCMEKLLQNAVDYHNELSRPPRIAIACEARRDTPDSPLISVVVRCGGRPLDILWRAMKSLADQTFGRFEVILVRYKPQDISEVVSEFSPVFESIVCVDCFGGNRSKTLWCGLNHVTGDYFAILDDDDELIPHHFQYLFPPRNSHPKERYFAYTGCVWVYPKPKKTLTGNFETRFIYTFGISECGSFLDQSAFFTPHSFVASSSLLDNELLIDPQMTTAEDSYLILSLLARAPAQFNFRATAVHHESPDCSGFASDPNRVRDLLTLSLRLLRHHGQRPQIGIAHSILLRYNESILPPEIQTMEDSAETVSKDGVAAAVPRQNESDIAQESPLMALLRNYEGERLTAGYRMLIAFRHFRNGVAPEGSSVRGLYDRIVRSFRPSPGGGNGAVMGKGTVMGLGDDALRELPLMNEVRAYEADSRTAGYRMLSAFRRFRNRAAPTGSSMRKLYNGLVRPFRPREGRTADKP